jgi:hypothetical protein
MKRFGTFFNPPDLQLIFLQRTVMKYRKRKCKEANCREKTKQVFFSQARSVESQSLFFPDTKRIT